MTKNKITPKEFENSGVIETELIRKKILKKRKLKRHKLFLQSICQVLEKAPLPEGLSPPISKNKGYIKQSWYNLDILVANLINMKLRGIRTLAVSLSNDHYSKTKLSVGFINLLKIAEAKGLIVLKVGYFDADHRSRGRRSRIKPTKYFSRLLKNAKLSHKDWETKHQAVKLNRSKKSRKITGLPKNIPRNEWGQELTPKELKQILEEEKNVKSLNKFLRDFNIRYTNNNGKSKKIDTAITRIYNDDLVQGGRFYSKKSGYQYLTKAERSTITINGDKTIELDFIGMHIRILYDIEEESLSKKCDPYGMVLSTLGLNPKKIFKKYPSIRKFLKLILLAKLNDTCSEKQFIARRNYILNNHTTKESHSDQKRVLDEFDLTVEKVSKAFSTSHAPIKRSFLAGKGLRIQNIDSKIAFEVMNCFIFDKNLPILPVHDSFIVNAQHEKLARETMKNCYENVLRNETGTDNAFCVPIK